MKHHFINFRDETDLEAVVLGACGLSTKAIMEKTGLSPGQVGYRLHKADVHRSDYRNGTGMVWRYLEKTVAPKIRNRLHYELPPRFNPTKPKETK